MTRGIRVGKERVRRLMQEHGINARGKRKFVGTTDSKNDLPVASQPARSSWFQDIHFPSIRRNTSALHGSAPFHDFYPDELTKLLGCAGHRLSPGL